MSIHDLLEDTLIRWNSVDTEDQVTEALGFWCCYPLFHEQARLCKDWRNVQNTLNQVHVLAVNRLMKLAEKMALDSGAISTCGAICRESFSSGRRKSFSGALRNWWPECIGEFIYEFPEHEQQAIRTASEIIGRMNARFGPKHSLDFRTVNWFGTEYQFTAIQAACVKVLWEAWENGTPAIGDQTVLTIVDSTSERLPLVFRDHPAWGKMIVDGLTKGTHRLMPLG